MSLNTKWKLHGGTVFYIRKPPVLPEVVREAGKTDGLVHICNQSALLFGSDRREPVHARPVVALRRDGERYVVLPCTSKAQAANVDFFELDEKRVMWSRPADGRSSFAFCRYEVVDESMLEGKIGVMPQAARIELLNWLISRY